MKKLLALIVALFFATSASAASYVMSEKITQEVLVGGAYPDCICGR